MFEIRFRQRSTAYLMQVKSVVFKRPPASVDQLLCSIGRDGPLEEAGIRRQKIQCPRPDTTNHSPCASACYLSWEVKRLLAGVMGNFGELCMVPVSS
ncbi:hypothetical protein AVEN_170321-1 [Araneus ventricosus]|uniref:Uncharacterized protein n=1 Tax=Araneus ventricosus TaxID=182803 RepID=A0A4Y2CC15_ARAVE|nr:hypothetical protein AVEN_170321-1 [Araneus ventricosus]